MQGISKESLHPIPFQANCDPSDVHDEIIKDQDRVSLHVATAP
jgi:hypothetical protein